MGSIGATGAAQSRLDGSIWPLAGDHQAANQIAMRPSRRAMQAPITEIHGHIHAIEIERLSHMIRADGIRANR